MGDNYVYDAPQFLDFDEPETFEISSEAVETYFDKDHEFATTCFNSNLQEDVSEVPELVDTTPVEDEEYSNKSVVDEDHAYAAACINSIPQNEIPELVVNTGQDEGECSNTCDEENEYSENSSYSQKDFSKSPEIEYIKNITINDDFLEEEEYLAQNDHGYNNLRKSLSMSCLPQDKPKIKPLKKVNENPNNISRSSSVSKLQKKLSSSERLNILSQPKYGSSQSINQEKYVSMAEAVRRYQNQTPTRFRVLKPQLAKPKVNGISKCTIPQSPMLLSKTRRRPVTAMSTEEKELQDYEAIKKNVFKAKPVKSTVLEGAKMVHVEKKPTTEVKPFKLTEAPKKVQKSTENLHEFHAKPIPKQIYEPYKPVIKTHLITEAKTPKFMKKYTKEKQPSQEKEEKKPCKAFPLSQRTVPVPFSFEKRDKILLAKKEELIQKAMEETKLSHDYQAKPVPKHVLQSPKIKPRLVRSRQGSLDNLKNTKSEEKVSTTFKARPATVLQVKPFVPKKESPKLIEVSEFHLNTERRANERDKFEDYIKEKERIEMERKQQYEKQKMLEEQEEIARIRREAVRAAEPIRRYKEPKPVPVKPPTQPHTPKLAVASRRRNKENINSSVE